MAETSLFNHVWNSALAGSHDATLDEAADDEFAYHMLHATGSGIRSSLQHTLTYTGIATALVAAASGLWRLIWPPARTRRTNRSTPRGA